MSIVSQTLDLVALFYRLDKQHNLPGPVSVLGLFRPNACCIIAQCAIHCRLSLIIIYMELKLLKYSIAFHDAGYATASQKS